MNAASLEPAPSEPRPPSSDVSPEDGPPALDPKLAAVLAEREVACPACGYNLRGLSTPDCPECGVAITWEGLLQRVPAVSLAWLVGLIGLAVSLPECFLKWQRLAFRRLFFYGDQHYIPSLSAYIQPDATVANPLFIGSTLYWYLIPVAMVGWWLVRRRVTRWPWWLRWGAAAVLLAAAVLGHRRLMWWYYALGYGDYAPWPMWYIN